MNVAVDEKTGLHYREGTVDAHVLKQMKMYDDLIVSGQTVMDIGAHIGAFTIRALEKGALKVIAVEPEPNNFVVFQLNWAAAADPNKIIAYNAAAVGDESHSLTLYTTKGSDTWGHSCEKVRGRRPIDVQAINICSLCHAYGITSLKINAECGEYDILRAELPPSVRYLAVMFHLFGRDDLKAKAETTWNHLLAQRFVPVGKTTLNLSRRTFVGVFAR